MVAPFGRSPVGSLRSPTRCTRVLVCVLVMFIVSEFEKGGVVCVQEPADKFYKL